MSDQSESDDGYMFHLAITALRSVGSSEGSGWAHIREFWVALADGTVRDDEAAQWARAIAERLVRDVFHAEPGQRSAKALVSIGLVGVEGKHNTEREYLHMRDEFRALAQEDGRNSRTTRRQLARLMQRNGYFEGISENQAMKVIDYLRSQDHPKN